MANADISASSRGISTSSAPSSAMRAKFSCSKWKSASAQRYLRPFGTTMDITNHPSSDVIHVCHCSHESRIVAFMFTKRQWDGWRGYWDLSISGNCWKEPKLFDKRQ